MCILYSVHTCAWHIWRCPYYLGTAYAPHMALRMHRWNWGEASIEATTLTFTIGGMRTSKAQPPRCLHTAAATATTPPPPPPRRRRRRATSPGLRVWL